MFPAIATKQRERFYTDIIVGTGMALGMAVTVFLAGLF